MHKNEITFVLISNDRLELLEKTLSSFFTYNTCKIKRFIIIDDSNSNRISAFLSNNYPEIEFISNKKRLGQIASIDKAYNMVDTEWIFHCEDDWEFFEKGFIENSMAILCEYPKIINVWIRDLNDTNGHPYEKKLLQTKCGIQFHLMKTSYKRWWHGFTFNPSLKRLSDWEKIGRYKDCKIRITDKSKRFDKPREADIGEMYYRLGYRAAILTQGYIRHTGWDCRTQLKPENY